MVPAPQEPGQTQHAHQVLREHVGLHTSQFFTCSLWCCTRVRYIMETSTFFVMRKLVMFCLSDKVSHIITNYLLIAGGDLLFIYVYLAMGFGFCVRWAQRDYLHICSSTVHLFRTRRRSSIDCLCLFSVSLDVGHKTLLVWLPLSGTVQQYQPPC